ncbi:MAG: hypothetical protein IT308_08025 [Anaerolineaceae bacterium]|nr:hypothetical protein [Anaerolineaceae bacterium]
MMTDNLFTGESSADIPPSDENLTVLGSANHTLDDNGGDEPEWDDEEEDEKASPLTLIIVGAVAVVLLGFLIWLYLPVISLWVGGARTPTAQPVPPTHTPRPTRTPTITPTPTTPPTATLTPYAPSAYSINSRELQPPLPWMPASVMVLNDDTAVTPFPDFLNPAWSPSSAIATQLPAIVISEPYHTTFGGGSALWQMDAPLKPGLYELYVSDTLYSSSGTLDFIVSLDGQEIKPLTSGQRVEYRTTSGTPPQLEDLWHSIGIYSIERDGLLSVSTAWEPRDEFTGPVAIDRVLIIPQPEVNTDLLARIPAERTKYIVDDTQAAFDGVDFLLPQTGQIAWNGEYEKIINTASDVRVVWELQDNVPTGVYEVAVFIPEIQGNAMVTYRLLANGVELPRSDGAGGVASTQGSWPGGQWVLLGSWEIPRIYEPRVRLSLQMDIAANTPGEAAADAVIFIQTSPPATE